MNLNILVKTWIGEEKTIDKEFWLNKINREGMTKIEGYNQALQDLTSRIPELEEMIVQRIVNETTDIVSRHLYNDNYDLCVSINKELQTTLSQRDK